MSFNIGLFDEDDELRYIFPNIELANKKKKELGWGYIYNIRYNTIGKEIR